MSIEEALMGGIVFKKKASDSEGKKREQGKNKS